ncbi:MAG: shikimate kinase [Bacteroidales bacterium]|nr:shikimate kinase [Bacteroidales bacterium]
MNVSLIGMPGCGKTTNGIFLARAAGLRFLDTDREIERRCGKKLSALAEELGTEGFRDLEGRIIASLEADGCVISTGGSAVYRPEAMARLKALGPVVYLRLRPETVEERVRDPRARGVSLAPGQTLRALFDERTPLYERYADAVVDVDGLLPREAVPKLMAVLGLGESPQDPDT